MTKKIALIIAMLMLSLSLTESVFAQYDIISFALVPSVDLITYDPAIPVTWQATIQNTSALWSASGINYGFSFLDPLVGLGTVMLDPGLPTFLMHGATWTENFASFDFFDYVPLGSIQRIQFWVAGNVENKGVPFDTKYQTASATLVPEPSSLLLLGAGLVGLVGIRVVRKRKK